MHQRLGLALLAVVALTTSAYAAPERQRLRGTITASSSDTLTIHTATGDIPVLIGSQTKYLQVEKSSLSNIEQGSFIGTATKTVGSSQVALEVVVFPPAMKGTGEGHYDWDRIPDTTASGATSTDSVMTNGTVSTAPTTMTNGAVAATTAKGGARQLTVTYNGGKQTIMVPPSAPIVTFAPGTVSDIQKGAHVFIIAMKDGDKVTANVVAIGQDGVTPPM